MARINLLPWREELRREKQREFAVLSLGVAILAALAVLLVHMQVAGLINHQLQRNAYLEQRTAELDERIAAIRDLNKTRSQLLARMGIIQELQGSRPLSVHLLDDIVRTLPEGVYLTAIEQQGEDLTLSGIAQSNARVSAYMRNIEDAQWLGRPSLDVIETREMERRRLAAFTLHARRNGQAQGAGGEE